MKNTRNFFGILTIMVGILITQSVSAEANATAAEETTINPAIKTFGWYLAKQGMEQMQFTESEQAVFIEGFKEGLTDSNTIESRQADFMQMQTYFQQRMMEMLEKESAAQEANNTAFFAELDQNENILKSDSGLYYEIVETGDDVRASDADSVTLHYHGTLIDGTVFDSSKDRGEPATFPVSGVVPGFSEGVKLVGNGGKVKLYIPPVLGYGDRPGGRIPPNATLIFDIEMIAIEKQAVETTE